MSSQNSEARRGRPAIRDDGRIIDAVTDTFWRRGYAATSIGDLAAASGAARNSLYKLYGDKGGLLAAAIDRYAARFEARVAATLARGTDPETAVIETLRTSAVRLTDPAAPPGCLRCRATMEMRGQDGRVDAALDRAHRAFEDAMARLLSGGAVDRDTGIRRASRFLAALVDGMVVLAEAGADRAVLDDVIEAARPAIRSALEGDSRRA